MSPRPNDWLVDYVPVEERIAAFYADHPEGSLQSTIVTELTTESRITIMAMAYRSPDDTRPGIGHSWLDIPGSTTFTRGSELENAETSAWGRALAALGYEVKRGIASREEVANKQPEQGERMAPGGVPPSATTPAPVPRSAEEQAALDELMGLITSRAQLDLLADAVQIPEGRRANLGELRAMIEIAKKPLSPGPETWPEVGSAAYKALGPYEKATARAWWQEKKKADKEPEKEEAHAVEIGF